MLQITASRVLLKEYEQKEITDYHVANSTCNWLQHYGCKVMNRPLYSPDLRGPVIPNSLHPLRSTWLARNFATDPNIKQAVTSWIKTHDKSLLLH